MKREEMVSIEISDRIAQLVNSGIDPVAALINVIGQDVYDDMIGRLYEELRASK